MEILQVNKLYFPWIGGIETAAKAFAEHYNGKGDISVRNLVCTPRGGRSVENVEGVITHRAATWWIKFGMPISFDFFILFKKLIKTADVVVLHHPFPLACLAFWLFGHGKRLVVWYHSDIVRQRLLKLPFQPFLHYVLRKADCILVSNETIVRESTILQRYAGKCSVAYFGVEPSRFALTNECREKAAAVRARIGDGPLILSVGRLVPYKGFRYLIDAMKSVSGKLLILGSGPDEPKLRGQIASSGLEGRVQIEPSVPDLVPYYHACDVFALPSCQNSEVFGIVQIEALACGKPVVNTALPTGVPEVSVHGYSGYTVPPMDPEALADALTLILENPGEYGRLSTNARIAVLSRFTTQTMFAAIHNAIAPILSTAETRNESLLLHAQPTPKEQAG